MNPVLSRTAAAASVFFAFTLLTGAGPTLASPAQGHSYYVATTGSDSASGAAKAPFRTIQKCATVARPGDSCTIASGTYREAVKPAHDGTTFAAAPGADVLIDGTDPVTGWSRTSGGDLDALAAKDKFLGDSPFASAVHDGHIYQAAVTLDPALPGNQVFMDGALGVEAQWPYPGTDPLDPHQASAQSGTNTSVASTDLNQPAGYWNGARLTVRSWFITQTAPVTGYSPGTVTAAGLTGCVGLNDTTLFSLSGKLEELNHAGSWFYDSGAHRLYVWTPDGAPADQHVIEAKQRNWGIDLSGRSNVTLRGINVRGTSIRTSSTSAHDTIDGTVGSYLSAYNDSVIDPGMVSTPDGCAFLTAGETTSGIVLDGHDNTFRNGYLNWSAGNGIALLGNHNSAVGNTISNVDYFGSYAAGINLVGSNEIVQHNTVFGTGRSDLNIDDKVASRVVAGSDISYNDFSDYSHLVTDDGAIYICCFNDLAGTKIHHNVLHDPSAFGASFAPGIYVDNSAFDATVYDNVAYGNTTEGLVLFNGEGSKGNRVYNNTTGTDTNAVTLFGTSYTDMVVENNVGNVDSKPGVTESHNVPYSTDPLFTSPLTHDFSVQAASPARNAAVVVHPATDGYRDRKPTAGAYQYGVQPWTGGSSPAQTVVQAERYSDNSGVSRHYAGTGSVLGSFDGGDWAAYTGVDFETGRNVFVASVGADPQYAGKSFQIRLDSVSGPVAGTMTMPGTGGFDTFRTESVPITTTKGVHDVYLVAAADAGPGVGNIDWFSVVKP